MTRRTSRLERIVHVLDVAWVVGWSVVTAVIVVAMLIGCSRPPAPLPPSRAAEVRAASTHCLVAVAVVADQETDLELCSSTAAACEWFYAAAVELGYPVLSVGECEER